MVGGQVQAFELLTEAEAEELIELFRVARENEMRTLYRTIDLMMEAMPGWLRATTRKIMFGGH